jgi:hypothetical protein
MTPQHEANAAESHRRKKVVKELRELIAALDRRVPQIEREGEQDIARDSALLKKKAEERIVYLEQVGEQKS